MTPLRLVALAWAAFCLIPSIHAAPALAAVRTVSLEERCEQSADLEVWVRAGRWFEPQARPGLARLTAETLLRAGTAKHGGPEVVTFLCNKYGIEMTAVVEGEFTRFRLSVADEKSRELGIDILLGRLTAPRVGESELQAALAAVRTSPSIAGDDSEFDRVVYARAWGEQHPRAKPYQLEGTTWDEVVAFYAHYRPENIAVGLNGGVALSDAAKQALESWQPTSVAPKRPGVAITPQPGPTIALLPAGGDVEPHAVLVRAVDLAALDVQAADVAAALRLVDSGRQRTGSALVPSFGTLGEIRIPLRDRGPLASTIGNALDTMGALGKAVDSETLTRVMASEVVPEDGDRLRVAVWRNVRPIPTRAKYSAEEVRIAAEKWLDPAEFHLVVIGNADLAPKLGKYGVPVDIVAPVGRYPADGSELLAAVVAASGGAEQLDRVKSLSWQASRIISIQGTVQESETDSVVRFPLEMWIEARTPVGKQTTVLADTAGWTMLEPSAAGADRTVQAMNEGTLGDYRRSLLMATTQLLKDHRDLEAVELAPEPMEGVTYRVLRVTRPGVASAELLVEPETYRIRRKRMTQNTSTGTMQLEELLDRYREVEGLWLPFLRTIYQNGEERVRISATSFELNPTIPEERFTAPKGDDQ